MVMNMKSGNNGLMNDQFTGWFIVPAGNFFLNVIVDVLILIGIAVNAVANKIQLQFYIVFYKTTPTHAQTAFPEPGKILALEYGAEKKNRNDYKGRFHNKKVAKF